MMVLSLFIIGHMGLFFYNKIGSIISIVDLPTIDIIEPIRIAEEEKLLQEVIIPNGRIKG
ncbi:TPA: hypothetical protein ACUOBN_002238 [Streptococcus pneumoniae]|uniref:DNA polymerase IV n=1 Tax=Streptococcus pneumoniae TaxID=1313 RepID=UPI00106F8704|nr:DNA polymerase IV [Streptococcus pneumoniae]MDA2873972.1 hypothetical protein [Streptococcus pneumoniae]MDA2876967.1 hypothetical protein [Streptococcus pneumoniae]